MSGVNKAILVGRLGKDPEVRTIPSGKKVASFSLATSEKYTDSKGQKYEVTEWHNVDVWDGLAEIVEKFLRKGSQLYVEGKIKTDEWEKDGIKQYRTKIQASSITMLGGGDNGIPT